MTEVDTRTGAGALLTLLYRWPSGSRRRTSNPKIEGSTPSRCFISSYEDSHRVMDEEKGFQQMQDDDDKKTPRQRCAARGPIWLFIAQFLLLMIHLGLQLHPPPLPPVACMDDARAFVMENAADVCVVRFYPRQIGGPPVEFNGEGTSMTAVRTYSIEGPCRVVDLDWTLDAGDDVST